MFYHLFVATNLIIRVLSCGKTTLSSGRQLSPVDDGPAHSTGMMATP